MLNTKVKVQMHTDIFYPIPVHNQIVLYTGDSTQCNLQSKWNTFKPERHIYTTRFSYSVSVFYFYLWIVTAMKFHQFSPFNICSLRILYIWMAQSIPLYTYGLAFHTHRPLHNSAPFIRRAHGRTIQRMSCNGIK